MALDSPDQYSLVFTLYLEICFKFNFAVFIMYVLFMRHTHTHFDDSTDRK